MVPGPRRRGRGSLLPERGFDREACEVFLRWIDGEPSITPGPEVTGMAKLHIGGDALPGWE